MTNAVDVLVPEFAQLGQAHAIALDQAMSIAAFDLQGHLVYANHNYLKLLGLTAQQAQGRLHSSFCPPAAAHSPKYIAFWAHVCAGQSSSGIVERLAHDGSSRWLEATYTPLLGPDGQPQQILKVATDITARHLADVTQKEHLHMLSLVSNASDSAIIISDNNSRLMHVNDGFCRMYGWKLEEIRGLAPIQLLAPLQPAHFHDAYKAELAAGRAVAREEITHGKDGQRYWVKAISNPVLDAHGEWRHTVTVLTDITHSKIHETLQRNVLEAIAREQPLAEVLQRVCQEVEIIAPDVCASIIAVDAQGLLHPLAAPSLPRSFSDSIDGVPIGPNVGSCGTAAWQKTSIFVDDIATNPLWADFKDQVLALGYCACWSTPIFGGDGQVLGTFAFYYRERPSPASATLHQRLVDACTHLCALALEREHARNRIRQLAYYDSVTGLPNRSLLMQQAEQAIAHAHEHNTQLPVLLINLDRFKPVNDSLGHHAGDTLLNTIATRLKQFCGSADIAGRLTGDEFALILPHCPADAITNTIEHLLEQLHAPICLGDNSLSMTASIGVAIYPDDGTEMETLLQRADMAVAQAKATGRGRFRFFSSDMNQRAQAHLLLETALREALQTRQLQLHYQPQVNMSDGKLYGVEALARWTHPKLGPISPAQFIPLAQECGLIADLGHWALQEACRQLAQWRSQQLAVPSVSVNLSPSSFHNLALPQMIADTLAEHGLSPKDLTLELTESIALDTNPSTMTTIHAIHAQGVRLSMDDFGTGYSSLSYLRRLPVSELKLDRSFVADIEGDDAARSLSRAIMGIGHSLDLTVVAEGIETPSQHHMLREQGYSVAQGYLFSRPLSPADLEQWLLRDKGTA